MIGRLVGIAWNIVALFFVASVLAALVRPAVRKVVRAVRNALRPDPLRALDGLATTYTHELKDAA